MQVNQFKGVPFTQLILTLQASSYKTHTLLILDFKHYISFFLLQYTLQDNHSGSNPNSNAIACASISKPTSSTHSRKQISDLYRSPPKGSELKLPTTQNKRFTDNIAPSRKKTFDTATNSVRRECILRYHLACKKVSKILDRSQSSRIRQRLNRHDKIDDVHFVVSDNLTTVGNCYHILHIFVGKELTQNSLLYKPVTFHPRSSNFY